MMEMALYARVSTERQEREQTVESQLTILKDWIAEHGHRLRPEHIYVDQGYSGARLDRPGLDRLRDAVQEGEIDGVVVLTPDRLARKYAYQVLLLEEFKRVGCGVTFVHRPLSDDPNDQLLLQIQGAVAEYERAVLGERFRRGKLQKARSGLYLAGKAPYGYRYIPKREGVPGYLVVDEVEADLVRMLYRWLIEERMTIRQILKRLNFGPWYPRSGKHPWSPSVVHHILADPIYTGTAYANRYRYVVPKKPRAARGPRTAEASCRQPKPQDEWIPIPVPAIIDQLTFERAREQLARNAALSYRHNTKYSYLLRCLLTCATCGLAMFGRQYKATATQSAKCYYTCHGKDRILSAREERCPQRQVKAQELEAAVWDHVVHLLADPVRLLAQFQSFSQAAADGDATERAEDQRLSARIDRLGREEKRLLDAYQAEVITLDELAQRRAELRRRRQVLTEEQNQRAQLRRERARAQEVLTELTAFCERVRSRLHEVTFEEKQTILQLLIERIIVKTDTLEIHHVIPLDTPVPGPAPPDHLVIPQLRSDGVHPAALPARPLQHRPDRPFQPFVRVADHELDPAQPPRDQAAQELQPKGAVLARPDVQPEHLPLAAQADPNRNHHREGHHASILPDLHECCIEPGVGVASLQAPLPEPLDRRVEIRTQSGDLALADSRHPQRLDQIVHAPGRDAVDVGFLDHRDQGLLGPLAGLEQTREETPVAHPGHLQLERPDPGVPLAIPVAIALAGAFGGPLVLAGAHVLAHLQLHQRLGHHPDPFPQEITVPIQLGLAQQLLECHP